jgi:hypothetical protein
MRWTLKSLVLALVLLPGAAFGQCNSSTPLPANTVLGRLGTGSGPCQAIPFSTLGPTLITSNLAVTAPLSISGLNLSITGAAGKVLGGSSPAFTATPTLGVASSISGTLTLANSANSGTVTIAAASTATTWTFKFPTTAGSNGQSLQTDGSGNTSWAAGAGTVNSGTAGQLAYYATTAAALSGNSSLNISSGALTIGVAGSVVGTACLANATSGSVCLSPATGALSTAVATFSAGTYNVVGDSLSQTLTNKTLTSPTINSATMTTPTLGVATATSINKVAITAPATSATLTIADGKTLTDTSGVGAVGLLGATGGGFTAYAGTSCTNQFIRSLSTAIAATCASVANTDLTNSSVTIGSTNVALGATAATVAGLTLTSPTINGGTATALTGLAIRSTGSGAFDLTFANTENLTAGRTLTLTLNNAARTISMSGNLTLAAGFTTAGGSAITLTATGATNVTLPTSGTLATIDTAQTFSGANIFSALTQFSDIKFSSGKMYPTADSTTAEQFCKADGTTCFGTIDSTNQAATFATLKFTTLDATSLGNSITTVTGLTVQNTVSASNDYIPYYSAGDGKIRRATIGSIASGATAGVSSFNGLTGGLSNVGAGPVVVSSSGSTVTTTGLEVFGFENCSLAASVGSSLLTVALKDNAGADPSATSPCRIKFRNATAATGSWSVDSVTTATSISTNATGATLGSSNNTAFRFWVVAFDNAGTVVLALINCSTATQIFPLNEGLVASTTAISGSATSAGVFYTPNGTTLSSKSFKILGYVEYNSTGLSTAGTYASAPNFVQSFGPGIKKPGDVIQVAYAVITSSSTTTSSSFVSTNTNVNITPTSAANPVRFIWAGSIESSAGGTSEAFAQLFRGSTAVSAINAVDQNSAALVVAGVGNSGIDLPNSTSSTNYVVKIKNQGGVATITFPYAAIQTGATILLDEIMGALPEIVPDNDNDPRLLNAVG